MLKMAISLLICLIGLPVFAAELTKPEIPIKAEVSAKNDDQKLFYAIGQTVAKQLKVFDLTQEELELVKEGLSDAIIGKTSGVDLSIVGSKLQQLAQARNAATGEKHVRLGKEFVDKAEKEKGATKTASGLIYFTLTEGSGDSPKETDTVKVNYRGTLIDGVEFDSSYKRNQPAEFKLDGVIKCWTEGLHKMRVGGKSKLICPSAIAYGDKGSAGTIPPGATLVFEVELLEIKK